MAVFLVVFGTAAALILLSPSIYRADARLRLAEPPPMTGVSPNAGVFGLLRMGGDPFANDLQLMRSRTVGEAVVEERALHVRLRAPRGWHRDSLFVSLEASRDTEQATFVASWTPDGRVQVRRTTPRDSLVGAFAPGEPARFGGVTAVFHPRRPGSPDRFRVSTVAFGDAVRGLQGKLRLQRASRDANVLDLRYDDSDPSLAVGVVASVISHFVALRTALSQRESGETVDSLRVVARQTLAELEEAEARLEAFQRETGFVAPEPQSQALVERYSDALTAYELVRAELDMMNRALQRVEVAEHPGQAWISLVAHPRFLENETVGEVLTRMTLLEQQRIELAATRTAENVALRTVLEQIDALDGTLRSLALSYRTGLEEQAVLLGDRVAGMEELFRSAPSALLELLRRQRDVRLLGEVVVLTEQRLRQEELRQALTFANVQVVDPAALQSRPVWPRRKLGLAVGLALATGFGLLAMVVVERADGSVRSASGLARVMRAPLLAAVPAGVNGRAREFVLSPEEASTLLRRGRVDVDRRAHLLLAPVGFREDAEAFARALENGAPTNGDGPGAVEASVTVLPPVDSHAAAESAAEKGTPVVLVMRAGDSDAREVARVLERLERAGATVAGGVLLCRTPREARTAWS